LKSTNMA